MTRANELVARLREHEEGPKPTVTDVLTKVCAAALMRHRDVNAQFTDDAILLFPTANVGIAVAAPQGLVVPVIHGAERLRLTEIAAARADLVSRARDGKLQRDDLEDGTFTISNLGMFGVEHFTAVLNPPQAAIVAVGATEERAVAVDGEVVVRPMMTMTGTCDHRAVDGAPARSSSRRSRSCWKSPRSCCEDLVPRRGPRRARGRSTATCSASPRRSSTSRSAGRALDRGATEIALGEAAEPPDEEGPVATIDVEDVKAERERLRRSGRRGRHRARAARGDAARRRLRPGRQPDPARRGPVVIRPAGPQDVPFLRDMLRTRTTGGWIASPSRASRRCALRRALGAAGRHGADRDRGLPARRRRVVPAVHGGQLRLRVRRRGDAGAVDRGRPEPARHGARLGAAGRAARAGARGRARRDQPQRRGRQPRDRALRAARLRPRRRATTAA